MDNIQLNAPISNDQPANNVVVVGKRTKKKRYKRAKGQYGSYNKHLSYKATKASTAPIFPIPHSPFPIIKKTSKIGSTYAKIQNWFDADVIASNS